jgi:D-aminopeptidase
MKKRARDLGLPFEGAPGKYNAITDVEGVEVGFSTIITGESTEDTTEDSDFARTGVTAILPRGKKRSAVFAGRYDHNGNGEMTGTHWIDDSGFLHGPLMITNTNSVGIVREAASKWMVKNRYFYPSFKDGKEVDGLGFFYPAVGETFDGVLNNINGFKVKEENAFEALESAAGGFVAEGNVGGGTGMRCHEFKGGTGTASRVLSEEEGGFTVGAIVQANHGTREEFRVAGIPFGKLIKGYDMDIKHLEPKPGDGSIIVVVATDAPVLPWQLSKMCRRVSLGIGNLGGGYQNGSGDIFLAFSTANENAFSYDSSEVTLLSDDKMDPIYRAVAQAVEEAIVNAMVAAEDMYGRNRNFVPALPHDEVERILKDYEKMIEHLK